MLWALTHDVKNLDGPLKRHLPVKQVPTKTDAYSSWLEPVKGLVETVRMKLDFIEGDTIIALLTVFAPI